MVKAKIICTIGPSSNGITVLRNMMLAGMDVARFNFSHGTHVEHQRCIDLIRKLNKRYRRHIKILQDLEGYRIRIGKLKDGKPVELKKKQTILLTNPERIGRPHSINKIGPNPDKFSDKDVIPFNYEGPLSDIKIGTFMYIDDGNIVILIKERTRAYLKGKVVVPGLLKEHKGINMPSLDLRFNGLTDKDKIDIQFGIRNKVDFIAQSFVRDKKDVIAVRNLVGRALPGCRIIAKIENRKGIKNIDEIIEVSDGIMIARGDMGVSIPIYEIPIVQKEIIKKCNKAKKFVITATQMLEHMTEFTQPTRAEVTDVANAILDGTDFVMLSAETASGKYPVEAVRMMNQIIKYTEGHLYAT